MNRQSYKRVYYEDALVIRWKNPDGSIGAQGKRVSASCKLYPNERAIYVKEGAIKLVKHLRDCGMSLQDAVCLMNSARGPITRPHRED